MTKSISCRDSKGANALMGTCMYSERVTRKRVKNRMEEYAAIGDSPSRSVLIAKWTDSVLVVLRELPLLAD